MRHLVGIDVLVTMALVLRFWLGTRLALDMQIHDVYRAVPLNIIGFWFLNGSPALYGHL
jgi:hypothetical protein